MQPGGVNIEPDPPTLPDHVAAGPALLRAVRGRGRDDVGLVEIELDAGGDLVEVVVSDLAAGQSGAAIAAAITQAFGAAREELGARLQQNAAEATERTRLEKDASVERLEDVAARAEQQLEAILGRLAAVAEKGESRG